MAEPENRQSAEGLSRLIAFADAVVAIALTLLVLPLVDIANDLREDSSVADVVSDNSIELVSFIISFGVIWILWRQHQQTMEYFRAYDRTLINLHFIWLLTIVALPFATALIDELHRRHLLGRRQEQDQRMPQPQRPQQPFRALALAD